MPNHGVCPYWKEQLVGAGTDDGKSNVNYLHKVEFFLKS
jgi:hypothetical protein